MTFDDAVAGLLKLAKESGGSVTAAQVESDPALAADRDTVSAAGHMLAGSTNVFASQEPDDREWFPYSELVFSETT